MLFHRLVWCGSLPLLWSGLLLGGCDSQSSTTSQSSLQGVSSFGPSTTSRVPRVPSTAAMAFPPDDLGRAVDLKEPARRVVAIGPGAVETIFALGAQKQLVGRDDYADFPPSAKKLAVGGNFQGPSVEQCVALHPDLVIVQGETYDKVRANDWQNKIGVPVAVLCPTTVAQVVQNVKVLGVWLGKEEAAQRLLEPWMALHKSPRPNPQPPLKAFIETGRSPLWVAGQNTLVGDTVQEGGFSNLTSVKGYQQFNIENLLTEAPDVYIVPSKSPPDTVLQQLRSDPNLSKLACVQTGHVIVINGDLLLRPGPRLFEGVQQLRADALKMMRERGDQSPTSGESSASSESTTPSESPAPSVGKS